ncbi:MAG: ATP-binding protein [Candidatus Nomurabacteria bacterium]|jgi:phosphohistidine swiveling domain-containing protein|nr:ATP-binding protein [Candidatus Nomurabacteria bacterium]
MEKETKFIDISPHRSLMTKISQTGYSIQEALSELIDNSIDARREGHKPVVKVDISEDSVVIADNGIGMSEEQTSNSIRLGFSNKKGQLGEFGLGMKTSTSFLGQAFTLITTQENSDEQYILQYDEDEWMKHGDWYKFPLVVERGVESSKSGTIILVSRLKVDFSQKMLESIQEEFGLRFGPFIQNGELDLIFNGKPCEANKPNILDDERHEFEFKIDKVHAHGWWGYQLSGLNKSYYGFHTFRRGRLVTVFDKIGLTPNQDIKQIVGELHIDGIPITHDKKGFIKESDEYKALENEMRQYFKPYERKPKRILSGYAASAGRVRGTVKVIRTLSQHTDIQKSLENVKRGDIVVTEMTRPQYLLAIRRAAGIITDLGGNLCHAAIVSREFNIPCVVGTQNATSILEDGKKVILDGNEGYIYED